MVIIYLYFLVLELNYHLISNGLKQSDFSYEIKVLNVKLGRLH